MAGPIGTILNSPCFRSNPVHFTGDVDPLRMQCVDLRGPGTTINLGNSAFQCEAVGKAKTPDVHYPDDVGPVSYPQGPGHTFVARIDNDQRDFTDYALDGPNYGITVTAKHPTLPNAPISI